MDDGETAAFADGIEVTRPSVEKGKGAVMAEKLSVRATRADPAVFPMWPSASYSTFNGSVSSPGMLFVLESPGAARSTQCGRISVPIEDRETEGIEGANELHCGANAARMGSSIFRELIFSIFFRSMQSMVMVLGYG